MHRILSWDAQQGIMRVEAGVTLQDMVQAAWKDGWWPAISPSTARVTIGGCAAMNINGRNAWKSGPFGATVLALEVLLANGEIRTLAPEQDSQLFHAFVGSIGLLGIITSITVQLQRLGSGVVAVRRRRAAAMDEIFALFAEEEESSDFMEAWLDGFARGDQLGRGHVTSARLQSFRPGGRFSIRNLCKPRPPGRIRRQPGSPAGEAGAGAGSANGQPGLLPVGERKP